MKILYMTISYTPEANGLYQNLVDSLNRRNHEITIVRSQYDIENTIYEDISDQLHILTVKTGNPFENNLVKKGMNQILLAPYFKNAIKKYLSHDKYDLILYATPPITLANVVKFCKKRYNAKTFLMLKDIFPQNAVDLGMMREKSIIYRYFKHQESLYYTYSDYIGCMSQGNKEYLLKHNPEISNEKVGIFPNSITVDETDGTIFNKHKTVIMFGGSLGKPQNIKGLLCIIEKLKEYDKAEFVIIGSGTEQKRILEFVEKYDGHNFVYKNFMPQKEYEKILCNADVGLISLDPRFTIPNIPSRFQTYLKLKKPVLAITDVNTDIKDMIIVNECGWWCDATNIDSIIDTIKEICENKERQILKGENGRRYLEKEFDVEQNVDILEKFIGE